MDIISALLPTVVVSVLFFLVIRMIVRMDKKEREAYNKELDKRSKADEEK